MASLIPITDPVENCETPKTLGDITRFLGLENPSLALGEDGSAWWFSPNMALPINERASNWMADRGLEVAIRGPVLFMSKVETTAYLRNEVCQPLTRPVLEFLYSPKRAGVESPTKEEEKTEEETVIEKRGRKKVAVVPIPGTDDTYDIKEKLKALGARWDGETHRWMVPAINIKKARELLAKV
jgi:hypothetical protein